MGVLLAASVSALFGSLLCFSLSFRGFGGQGKATFLLGPLILPHAPAKPSLKAADGNELRLLALLTSYSLKANSNSLLGRREDRCSFLGPPLLIDPF